MVSFVEYPTFMVFLAIFLGVIVTIALMPAFIKFLRKHLIGQFVRADGPESHLVKQGTPTMGGVIMLIAATIVVAILAEPVPETWLIMGAVLATGALGLFDDASKVAHERSLGSKYANFAVTNADLLVAVGARFSDRVTGKLADFAPEAKVIHVDVDPAEIGKNRIPQIPIVGDAKVVLAGMKEQLDKDGYEPKTKEWLEQIEEWRSRHPFYSPGLVALNGSISPEGSLDLLSDMLDPENSIVTTEVGQHQMWAAQHIDREVPRTFLTSGGLGTMGFGFPAAIGAKVACPDKEVVCVAGDGSFQMNSQEMATAAAEGINVKVLLMNNSALGMVHQWQNLFYEKRYSETLLPDIPDFVKLCDAYGWGGKRVSKPEELEEAFTWLLNYDGPALLDMRIDRDENVFPMVAPGAPLDDIIGATNVGPISHMLEGFEDLPFANAAEANEAARNAADSNEEGGQ